MAATNLHIELVGDGLEPVPALHLAGNTDGFQGFEWPAKEHQEQKNLEQQEAQQEVQEQE